MRIPSLLLPNPLSAPRVETEASRMVVVFDRAEARADRRHHGDMCVMCVMCIVSVPTASPCPIEYSICPISIRPISKCLISASREPELEEEQPEETGDAQEKEYTVT